MKRKIIAINIILLFTLMSIVPSISGSFEKLSPLSFIKTNDEIKVPDCVEAGDILIVDCRYDESIWYKPPGPYNEHAVLYVGNNYFIEADSKNGVEVRNYAHFHKHKNLVFLRVKSANLSQKQAAIDWAYDRIGAPYQTWRAPWFWLKIANPDFPNPTANKWYCMELVWAAYYNQGIDIDKNEWVFTLGGVLGEEIINDNDIEIIYREVNDSTEFFKPNKGIYIANKKIKSTFSKTIIIGKIDVEVVTLNENITRVDFYIDNIYKANDTAAPYKWTWDERVFGKKVLKAVACDDFGNQYPAYITVKKFF
ncbi:MAG: YiiX/YebB-like N1pC/P60 family cysteine hydrolase [Euryarchaeota archaeon]|nr:YiiX/YebB-like N1pC/P60 family cysteine hydrolase [Euryarchaeota archaeon]